MSNYNPEEILNDPNSHPTHKAYAEINIGIRDRGEQWAKCLNCGFPYQLAQDTNSYFCTFSCESEYADYL